MQKECKNCNILFFKKQTCSLKEWGNSKFCSVACHDIFRCGKPSASPITTFKKGHKTVIGYIRRGAENNKWKGGSLIKDCATCSKVFSVDRDRTDAKNCSMECDKLYRKTEEFRLHLSEVQRAKVSSELKDSKFIRNMLRTCSRYAIWREKVLKNDDYTCQECGKRGGKIQADHIEPFVIICLRNKIETYEQALACEELWSIKNGRTLCLNCHYKTSTFGSKVLTLLTKK